MGEVCAITRAELGLAPVWQQAALLLLTANGSAAPALCRSMKAPHPRLLSSGIRLAFWMPVVGCFVPWHWFTAGDRAVSGATCACEHTAAQP